MTKRQQQRALAAWAAQTREISTAAARALALALTIVEGHSAATQAYDLGIVIGDSETAWQHAPAEYSWRSERSRNVQHYSRSRDRSTINEILQPCTAGYHGELCGPAIAPIAVAAIATCHGPHALLDHPALEPLRVRAV
jgi:hypothetical protein